MYTLAEFSNQVEFGRGKDKKKRDKRDAQILEGQTLNRRMQVGNLAGLAAGALVGTGMYGARVAPRLLNTGKRVLLRSQLKQEGINNMGGYIAKQAGLSALNASVLGSLAGSAGGLAYHLKKRNTDPYMKSKY